MADAELRQRKPPVDEPEPKGPKARPRPRAVDDGDSPWLDVLRVLSFLLVASCGLSYVISGGQSWFWGMRSRPYYLRADWYRTQLRGPVYLTPDELAAYDGRDPARPLYLAINGTIFDVSSGRRFYGPGGSYSALAGADAARAFVTGCFAQDRTPDLRGAEAVFLPLDDPETDARWSAAELDALRARELAAARDKVREAVRHWVDFFTRSNKYFRVGYVRRDDGWLDKLPPRELCATAQKRREKRRPDGHGADDDDHV